MRRLGRTAMVVGAGMLVLSMFGCTPDEPGPGTSPSPAPSSPAASPTESDEDRAERERGEHAIEVYESADDELVRLMKQGAGKPSEELREYASGSYLDAAVDLLQQISADGVHIEGDLKRLDIRVHGTPSEDRVRMLSCEDASASKYVNESGETVGEGKFSVQNVEVERLEDGKWKVTAVESEGYDSLEETECADVA